MGGVVKAVTGAVGGVLGGLAPRPAEVMPNIPPPPPPPPPPSANTTEADVEARKAAAIGGKGRTSTMLTGGQGVLGGETTSKTLLGN